MARLTHSLGWAMATAVVLAAVALFSLSVRSGAPAAGDPPRPSVAAEVRQWKQAGGSRQVNVLQADFVAMKAAASRDDATMARSCVHLLADVKAAQLLAPIPDAIAENDWAHALTSYAQGATDCAQGAVAHDYPRVIRASNEFTQGTADVDKVAARLLTISGG